MTVGEFESKMLADFGLKVEVSTPDDWVSVPDGITLGQLRGLPKNARRPQQEALVGGGEKDGNDEIAETDKEYQKIAHSSGEDDQKKLSLGSGDIGDENEESPKWGFIDKKGKMVVEPQFDDVYPFGDGLYKVEVNGKYGFIDKKGKMVVEPQFERVGYSFEDGLCKVKLNGKWGFIDKTGKMVVEPQLDDVGSFNDGLCWVKVNGKTGFIDKKGKMVIEPQFKNIKKFGDGLMAVLR